MDTDFTTLLEQALQQRISGQRNSAIELYSCVFRKGLQERNAEALREALLAMGLCYREMGEAELAAEHLELAAEIAERWGDDGRAARALNGQAVLHMQRGENAAAERLYGRAKQLALSVRDWLTAGSIDHNLGTLSNIRGDLLEALAYYRSSLKYYEEIQHERNMAHVLNNLGMLYVDLDRLDEAFTVLDRALSICRALGDVVTEGIVQVNRAELFLALGKLGDARASCDEAFEIASRVGDVRVKTEALKYYGIIYRESKWPHLAEIHLRQAIGLASQHDNPLAEAETQRELALVLRVQERNRESLVALNRAHALFTSLQAKQDQADINKRIGRLEGDFLSLVRVWGESIEAKDRYTRGHCQRVADYACRIAESILLPKREMVWFRMGAFLHDVGKTEVPEEILNKPGRLTDEERELMERHTVIGDEMLSSIEFPWDIRSMVRSHHERWDGRGYPDALKGEGIPLTARILRLADVFDALTTTRSYRQPLTPEQAFQIMEEDHGAFDPQLFEVFRALLPEFVEMATHEREDTELDLDPLQR